MDLKMVCYYKREISVSENVKDELNKTYLAKIYRITSYDLEKNDKNEISATTDNKRLFVRNSQKQHTKLWLNFWNKKNIEEKYPIRLNPELKISFVDIRKEELEGKNMGKLNKNRRKEKQFLLSKEFLNYLNLILN